MSCLEVYAILNVPPQTQAFALAKVSRASGRCKDWIMALSAEASERFFEQYYQDNPYGHASIGDLGHPAIALEGVSQWVAHALELPWFGPWDGQELSTRYSSFLGKDCYEPDFAGNGEAADLYHSILDRLFGLYQSIMEPMGDWYRKKYPKLADWAEKRYESTVNARVFDVARYALPMAVKTAVMQVTSIRTLQRQIRFCRSDELLEVRMIGDRLVEAVTKPAFDVAREMFLRAELKDLLPSCLSEQERTDLCSCRREVLETMRRGILEKILPERSAAATLTRHTEPSEYLVKTRDAIREVARKYLPSKKPFQGEFAPLVRVHQIWDLFSPVQQTVAALLHWQANGHSFAEVLNRVARMGKKEIAGVFSAGHAFRTDYDEALPMFRSGYHYAVDWQLDIGALRDIHRQRRWVAIPQRPSTNCGFVVPQPLREASLHDNYLSVMTGVQGDVRRLEQLVGWEAAIYAMPFAQARSYLAYADLGQLDYVARLRANPNGRHFGYWGPAYDMCRQVIGADENLKGFMSATPLTEWDFYNRG